MTQDCTMTAWIPDILTRIPSVFRFFKELEERHQQSIVIDDISDIVCKHAQSNFDPYITYCSNEVYQQRTLQRLVWVTERTPAHKRMFSSYLSWIWASIAVLTLWTTAFPLCSCSFYRPSPFSLQTCFAVPRIPFLRRCWPGLRATQTAGTSPWSPSSSCLCRGSLACPSSWMWVYWRHTVARAIELQHFHSYATVCLCVLFCLSLHEIC